MPPYPHLSRWSHGVNPGSFLRGAASPSCPSYGEAKARRHRPLLRDRAPGAMFGCHHVSLSLVCMESYGIMDAFSFKLRLRRKTSTVQTYSTRGFSITHVYRLSCEYSFRLNLIWFGINPINLQKVAWETVSEKNMFGPNLEISTRKQQIQIKWRWRWVFKENAQAWRHT